MYRYKNYSLEEFLKLGNSAEKIRNVSNTNWDNQHLNKTKIETGSLKQTSTNYEIDLANPNKLNPLIKDNKSQLESPLLEKQYIPDNTYTNVPINPQQTNNQFNPNHYYQHPQYYQYPPYYPYPPNYNPYYQPQPIQTHPQQPLKYIQKEEEGGEVEFKTKTGKIVKFKSKKKKNPVVYNNTQKIENEQANVETLHKLDNKSPSDQSTTLPQH